MMEARPTLELLTPERVAVELDLAGIGARALAWLADALCIFLLAVTGLLLYSLSGDFLRDLQALSLAGQLLTAVSVRLVRWGWDVVWELLGEGQTPGKRLAGIRVIRADGGPPGLSESLLRNVLRAVELPLGYAPAILAVALASRRQRLGDLVAGTLVVHQRRYDLSRYDPPVEAAARRFPHLRGRARAALPAEGFERLSEFLRRRPELERSARGRIAARLAKALAARAGVVSPEETEAGAFLEAFAAWHAEGT